MKNTEMLHAVVDIEHALESYDGAWEAFCEFAGIRSNVNRSFDDFIIDAAYEIVITAEHGTPSFAQSRAEIAWDGKEWKNVRSFEGIHDDDDETAPNGPASAAQLIRNRYAKK